MKIEIANKRHIKFAVAICDAYVNSAKDRGTGIAKRSVEYIIKKIENNDAMIATEDGKIAAFCYIESWGNQDYIANSGLIVFPDFRKKGLAKRLKYKVFEYSKKKYPQAKFFGITTGLAIMKINYQLGYRPVTFSELPKDDAFWKGCQTCKNYDILQRTEKKMCLCTGMLYDSNNNTQSKKWYNEKVLKRLKRIKQYIFLNSKK